jgi:hypothetical protein
VIEPSSPRQAFVKSQQSYLSMRRFSRELRNIRIVNRAAL